MKMSSKIPFHITAWLANKGWKLRAFQKKMYQIYAQKQSALLSAPTGEGKTLASFLPVLSHINSCHKKLHTLYISPLKALTYDIERNLLQPISDMQLNIAVESRTGDTSAYRRQRQLFHPPHILLTTPESLMLMLSYPQARLYFSGLQTVIIDELHTFTASKRGDLTALALSRLKQFAPLHHRIGLSATAGDGQRLARWLKAEVIVSVLPRQKPCLKLLISNRRIPYSGYRAAYAVPDIYKTLLKHQTTLIFTHTRAQAEILFQALWKINSENLPIAVYHSALSKELRLKTASMAVSHQLRAVITTSALEMGIDWDSIDCVIQIGAPKSINRLIQRAGRSNHQFNQKSLAYLVPANMFEVLECKAALNAIRKNQQDWPLETPGALEIVIQYIMNCACSEAVILQQLYQEVIDSLPYQSLSYPIFKKLCQFVIDGGYVLKHYPQYHRLRRTGKNRYETASPQAVRRHRQNIGVIIEHAKLKIRRVNRKRGKFIGEIAEAFALQLRAGDTFLFGGEALEYIRLKDMHIDVKKSADKKPKIPSYAGGQLPIAQGLPQAVLALMHNPALKQTLPLKTQKWLNLQEHFSALPQKNDCLIEHFPYAKKYYTAIYTFLGAAANHTLGALLCDALESEGLNPINFTLTDYGLAIASLNAIENCTMQKIWPRAMRRRQLEKWISDSSLLKRAFRQISIISGLVHRKTAGSAKTLKQATFSTDLIFDVLMRHEPDHILLALAKQEVERHMIDMPRLKNFLAQFKHIRFVSLPSPSPFSLPILFSQRTEKLQGSHIETLLTEKAIEQASADLIQAVKKHAV